MPPHPITGQEKGRILMSRRTLKLGAILIGVGGPGQHSTWLSPEIPGNASVDVRWYIVDSQFITAESPGTS
jgi:hypothetical protein